MDVGRHVSSIKVEVVFEGPAVKEGTIDARLLAESLLGYSEVFTRANAILNGEASEAVVLVESDFKRGSFVTGLDLVQNIADQARHLITAHPFLDATGLATIIGFVWKNKEAVKDSLIELFKWLRGKNPDKTLQVGDNNTEITFGVNKKIVNNLTLNLYGDPGIREGLSRLTGPLREAAIERIAVRRDGTEQTSIEKSEAEFFEPGPLDLTSDDSPMQGERNAMLIVSKLSFTEGTTWTFLERGAIVNATIQDEGFWRQVHEHKVTFGEGDRLRVRMAWVTVRKRSKLTAKNRIVKVYEIIVDQKPPRLEL